MKTKSLFENDLAMIFVLFDYLHVQSIVMRTSLLLLGLSLLYVVAQTGIAPFISPNQIHQVGSQFEFNLILNENRNIPIILLQYSRDNTLSIVKDIIEGALEIEKDISFAVHIDCRQFSYDLNGTLGLCKGFKQQKEVEEDENEDKTKINDAFFRLDFFSPNPTRIKEKGHLLSRNHDMQDLRQLNANFNPQFLAKVIRNEVPDFVNYIEDQTDLDEYLKLNSQFRLSKGPKLIFFDHNLQSPLFLKKLAVGLEGWVQVAVSDSSRLAASFNAKWEDLVFLEYDFQSGKYDIQKIQYDPEDAVEDVLNAKSIKSYTNIRKPRDILLDFEHRVSLVYNLSSLKQVNQLISHGRIIVLQISDIEGKHECAEVTQKAKLNELIFNFACFSLEGASKLLTQVQLDPSKGWKGKLFIIDGSLKKVSLIDPSSNLFDSLPKSPPRQQITTVTEGEHCVKAAKAADKQPIFYYFNEKTHSKSLSVLKYFNSLPEINSLLYFCQFYLPDEQVTRNYRLTQNAIFSLGGVDGAGNIQKIEHKKMEDFISIKMFLREVAISRMLKVYDQKIIKNEISEISSAEQLTQNCFSERCVIALIETDKFHQESELSILKEMQIAFSDSGLKFHWIDGICHYEIGKQLKLTEKGSKLIDRSHLFLYREKGNEYSLWRGGKINKFWDKKEAFRWVKSLKKESNIGRIKFGIDVEDKPCARAEKPKTAEKEVKPQPKPSKKEVNSDEL